MSIFNYQLPSGSTFRMTTPAGTTQLQADLIFYSQVAAGALVGYSPGQTLTSSAEAVTKFGLNRLDRGTAGVDTQAILAIVNTIPTITGVPTLINTPLTNPINQADLVNINSGDLSPNAIGPLSSTQVQGILAQIANLVDQESDVMSDDKGVGQYGLSCVQLEQAGYVKPGSWQRFIFDPAPLTQVLASPGIWTGRDGVTAATQFLGSPNLQTKAQVSLLNTGYNGLVSAGVITPSRSSAISASQGQVYTQSGLVSQFTNTAVGDVSALVANAGRFGTAATAAWSQATTRFPTPGGIGTLTNLIPGVFRGRLAPSRGLDESNTLNNFSGSLNGLVGDLGSNVNKLTSSLDITGKAAKFASQFGDPLASLKNLSNFDVTSLIDTGNLTRSLTNAGNTISSGLASLTSGLPNFSGLVNLAGLGSLGSLGGLFGGGGDELVSSTQVAAGYSNTVNRGTLDVAIQKIIGSAKVPLPVFDSPSPGSISLNANKDILAASNILQGLRGLGGTVLTQANQITNTVNTASEQVGGVISNALNRFV